MRSSRRSIDEAIGTGPIHVPAHFDAEVYVAIRRQLLRGLVDLNAATIALFDLRRLRAERHLVGDLITEALAARDRFGGYDVFYVVLAKRLGAAFVTADEPLALAAASYGIDVRYVTRSSL